LDDERLISLSEAAAVFGLSPSQLRLVAQRGRLRATKVGRNWITTPKAVADYMADEELRSKDPYKYKRG
jgi:predicted transcriptional regulator of viral defense system